MEIRWVVGEKDLILVSEHSKGGKMNDRILVRVDPTSKTSMVPQRYLPRTVVMAQKDSPSVQKCGVSSDWSVPGDNVVPE
jgi:hypothetical protein